jgi:hypothetical protein
MKCLYLIIMLCLGYPVLADSAKFERRGTVLVYNSNISDDKNVSQITSADVQLFKDYIEDKRFWKKIWTIRLTSKGGNEEAAYKIADFILKHKLDTQAAGMCASACTDIFLAGKKRRLMRQAKLFFHPHYLPDDYFDHHKRWLKDEFPNLDYMEAVAHNERLSTISKIARFASRGIDLEFSLRVLSIHPDEEWIPTRHELESYGVIN